MAQRKPGSPSARKPGPAARKSAAPAKKAAEKSTETTAGPVKKPVSTARKPVAAPRKPVAAAQKPVVAASKPPTVATVRKNVPPGRPPARKPGKSIVNQKQTPWALISVAAVLVLFAAAIVVYAVASHKSSTTTSAAGSQVNNCKKMIGSNKTTYLNELTCAHDISGVTFTPEANREHVAGTVKYDATPPVGGNHSPYWADCSGTVYPAAIANENAVHMLEHGAIWITYNAKTLSASGLKTLQTLVDGQDRMALSPYPSLKTAVSVQAWGYQLFLKSATDPRLTQFVNDLRYNPLTTPEYGATCSQPTFKDHPSTFGHPLEQPAT